MRLLQLQLIIKKKKKWRRGDNTLVLKLYSLIAVSNM